MYILLNAAATSYQH